METIAIVVVALIGFAAFNLWLRQQRRMMVHRERLAAVEKGVEPPPFPPNGGQLTWNVQAILLLAGLCWIGIGIGTFVVLSELINNAPPLPPLDTPIDSSRIPPASFIPKGLHTIGVVPLAIGIAHLIVYLTVRKKRA